MQRHESINVRGPTLRRALPTWTQTCAILALAMLLMAGSGGWLRRIFRDHGSGYEAGIRLALLAIAVLLGIAVFRRQRRSLNRGTAPRTFVAARPDVAWLLDLQGSAAAALNVSFSKESVVTFVALVSDPARYRTRVEESATAAERVITQRVSVEFTLPQVTGEHRTIYVPLLSPLKGELLDSFRSTDASGRSISDLSFDQTTELAAAGLRLLLVRSAIKPVGGRTSAAAGPPEAGSRAAAMVIPTQQSPATAVAEATTREALNPDLHGLELSLLGLLARRGPVTAVEAEKAVHVALRNAAGLLTDDGREQVRRYVLALSVSYPVVAVVPAEIVTGNAVLLRYERALIPESLNQRGIGVLRVILGIKPYQIAMPLQLAFTAKSYHLRLSGPANKYVRGQFFRCRRCKQNVERDWEPLDVPDPVTGCYHTLPSTADPTAQGRVTQISNDAPYFRVRAKRGQNFVHLYMRGYADAGSSRFRDLDLFAQFKEVPPGSRAIAAVTAFACTVLVGVVGHLVSTGRAPLNSDVPALLLALPAAVSSWFGLYADDPSLVGLSLLARLSQLVTAAVSFTAIAAYYTGHRLSLPFHVSILGITNVVWVGLFVLSALNFLYVLFRFALKVRHYNDLLRKKERLSDAPELW